MPDSYTYSAYRVLARANALLPPDGDAVVEPEHILLALAEKSRGLIADTLNRSHIPPPSVRAAVTAALATAAPASVAGSLFSDRSVAALSHAASEAAELGDDSIDVEHLFLGLLHDEAVAALEPFVQGGLTLGGARAMLLVVRTGRL